MNDELTDWLVAAMPLCATLGVRAVANTAEEGMTLLAFLAPEFPPVDAP